MPGTLVTAASALLASVLVLAIAAPADAAEKSAALQHIVEASPAPQQPAQDEGAANGETTASEAEPARRRGRPAVEEVATASGSNAAPVPAAHSASPHRSNEPPRASVSASNIFFDSVTVGVEPDISNVAPIDLYTITVTRKGGGYSVTKTTATAGSVDFTELPRLSDYRISVRASSGGVETESTLDFSTPDDIPERPQLSDVEVGMGKLTVVLSEPLTVRGAVDFYRVKLSSADGEEIAKERTNAGSFEFTGLPPGLYELEYETANAYGGSGTSDIYVIIPEEPLAPQVAVHETASDFLTVKVDRTTRTYEEQYGAIRAPFTYTLTLTGGGKTVTEQLAGNLQYFTFEKLDAETAYTVRVVASNLVGASPSVAVSGRTLSVTAPEPPQNPIAPLLSDLTEETRGELTVPEESAPGTAITVALGSPFAGKYVSGWLFSAPTALGSVRVDAEGNASFVIPGDVPAGAHSLVVTAANNNVIGWRELRVTDGTVAPPTEPEKNPVVSGGKHEDAAYGDAVEVIHARADRRDLAQTGDDRRSLPQTGSESPLSIAGVAAVLIAAGAALVTLRRRFAAR